MIQSTLRYVGIRNLTNTECHGIDNRLLIDSHVQRLTDFLFRKCTVLMIDQQMIFACGRIFMDLQIWVFFQLGHTRERYEDRGIQLTCLHVEHPRIIVGDRNPLDTIKLDAIRLPEIRILFQNNTITTTPFVHHKRARRHWLFRVTILAQFLYSLFRKNRDIGER